MGADDRRPCRQAGNKPCYARAMRSFDRFVVPLAASLLACACGDSAPPSTGGHDAGGAAGSGGAGGFSAIGGFGGNGGETLGTGGAGGQACVAIGAETCATPTDEDCDGTECGLWGRIYGDSAFQAPRVARTTKSGEVFFAGGLDSPGSLQFDGTTLASSPGASEFVAKLSTVGEEQWVHLLPGPENGMIVLAPSPTGDVVTASLLTETVDVGTGPLVFNGSDYPNGALISFDSAGGVLWSAVVEGAMGASVSGLEVAPNGAVIALGRAGDGATYDGQVIAPAGTASLLLFAVAPSDGSLLWAKDFPLSAGTQAALRSFGFDTADNLVVGGQYLGDLSLGGAALPPSGANLAGVIARFDPAGNHVSSSRVCDGGCDVWDVAVGAGDELYVAGTFSGTCHFGATTQTTSLGAVLPYVAKMTSPADVAWFRTLQIDSPIAAAGHPLVGLDETGTVALAVEFESSIDVGTGAIPAKGIRDLLIGKLDAAGNPLWTRQFGAANTALSLPGSALAVQPTGEMTLALGQFGGAVDYGFGPLTPAGLSDVAVVRFAR